MQDVVHEEKFNDYTITIHHDPDPQCPRQYDNLGTLTCGHGRYRLGDPHGFAGGRAFLLDLLGLGADAPSGIDALFQRAQEIAVILPVYLYDHSGLAMNTTGFNCPWDSGQVGFIHVTIEKIRREFGVRRVSADRRAAVAEHLRQEVATYSDFLAGHVYGYVVERDGEDIDSCWGFIGDHDAHCLEEARSCVAALTQCLVA